MVTLSPGKAFSSAQPTLVVENVLALGRHLFQLVVVDDSGNESAPVDLVISVEKPTKSDPTPPGPRTPDPESLRAAETLNQAALRNLNLRNIRPK
ncbi:hypothetical protein MZO42_16225 [Sphingomonas psychrotolerans]|uniref:Uncharacterized protein n=1 Tax=Sphingomonas psychrotolerans TaxID=1327635 RepID=A0ABU3N6Z1_9SPHN|nr:hypothetical protein [Sphingomonas psychrotolerans]MDT8760248.1 hypothetical protein [Sphingomonas psychrotolerans]